MEPTRQRYYRSPKGRAACLLATSRQRAIRIGVQHAITAADIIPALTRGKCEVSGVHLDFAAKFGPFTPSIDRWNNELGYVPGNVRVVCWAYNAAKGSGTDADVLKLAAALLASRLLGCV